MSDRFTPQLSAYLDGELDELGAARLESHLSECLECARTLADLRAIVAAAPGYAGREPAADLWPAIAARLDEPEVVPLHRRTGLAPASGRHFGWRELIAASLVMAALGGGTAWLALRQGQTTVNGPLALAPDTISARLPGPEATPVSSVVVADRTYDAAVKDLESLLASGRDRLDTATVRTIEQSLVKIDAAIAEARAAIQRDPANGYLNRQIAANMRRKITLLRVATHAIAART